jgi:hypothetical protein
MLNLNVSTESIYLCKLKSLLNRLQSTNVFLLMVELVMREILVVLECHPKNLLHNEI